MEQERDTNLQVDPLTVIMIVESCIQAAVGPISIEEKLNKWLNLDGEMLKQ